MTSGLDRRIEQFQVKVQQKINLADDEIARQSDYLNNLQAEISEYEDKMNRFTMKSDQLSEEKNGRKRRQKAQYEAKVAKLKAEHHASMQEIQSIQSKEVNTMNEDFENTLAEIEKSSSARVNARVQPVESDIEKVTSIIAKLKENMHNTERLMDPHAEEDIKETQKLEITRIQKLEKLLNKRSSERLTSLVKAKEQLADCVSTLEELEQQHTITMDNLRSKLQNMDAKYDEKLAKDTAQHQRNMDAIRRKIRETQKKTAALQKAMKKAEQRHKEQIMSASKESEQLKLDFKMITSRKETQRKEDNEAQVILSQLDKLRKEKDTYEATLSNARGENEALKREIGRLSYEIRLAKRREALKL